MEFKKEDHLKYACILAHNMNITYVFVCIFPFWSEGRNQSTKAMPLVGWFLVASNDDRQALYTGKAL